jgi:hypothetical protein
MRDGLLQQLCIGKCVLQALLERDKGTRHAYLDRPAYFITRKAGPTRGISREYE